MGENVNKAKMAELLADGVLGEFRWQKTGTSNIDWGCEDPDAHGASTHPSDVVFFYDEPYSANRTYVNIDLKSYAKNTLRPGGVRGAIENLAKAVACAERSNQWSENYVHEHVSAQICGLLFIYNHDGEYDSDFNSILAQVKGEKLDIPPGSKIVVFGPRDVHWLNNVHHEIAYMRGGKGTLPKRDYCRFYYPHLVKKKNVQEEHAFAATLEMLTGPWITLKYAHPDGTRAKGYVIFSRRRGESVDEYLYMIDYLLHYQMLHEAKVHIRVLDPEASAAARFGRAKDQYVEQVKGGQEMAQMLDTIEFGQINDVRTTFSEIEIGML